FGVGAGDRELHSLVLANGAVEHAPFSSVVAGGFNEPAGIAEHLGGGNDAFGVHAVENVAKATPFLTDAVFYRHFQAVDEDLGGVVIHHGAQRSDLEAVATGFAQVHHEHRQALGFLFDLIGGRGAHQQHHEIGVQRT